jgi:hypothetical protein
MPRGSGLSLEASYEAGSADSAESDAETTVAPAVVDIEADVVVYADRAGRPIDRRVFGTNLPAWLGGLRLAEPAFREAAVEAGVTLVRMPGGSWSNAYDWRACEEGDPRECVFSGAARPSDFAGFLEATGLEGMWTVSINDTAESAAAAVAFFNGSTDDQTPIGVDREGVDWGTVATWAQLRTSRGFEEPIGIALWEVGNEVFGGKPEQGGEQCADFGWEDVWTCDGAAYIEGDATHDGYLAIREAMVAVDETVSVGAVGVVDPGSWSNWGFEVIERAGDSLDFYVVHHYGFGASPEPDEALDLPGEAWPAIVGVLGDILPDDVPIAVTEYNLVSFGDGDTERSMTTALNALYTADSLGQLVDEGVPIANHWNLANGTMETGTDYGLINVDHGGVHPAYEAFRLWGRTGDELLEVDANTADGIRIHATRTDDGTIAIVALNLADEPTEIDMAVLGLDEGASWTTNGWRAERLDDRELTPIPVAESDVEPGAPRRLELPAWSMMLVEVG